MKKLYRPFGVLLGIIAGRLGGSLFTRVWKLVAHQDDPPKAMESEYGWRELLIAATIEGAIYGLVKAVVARGGAKAFERATGSWPGD